MPGGEGRGALCLPQGVSQGRHQLESLLCSVLQHLLMVAWLVNADLKKKFKVAMEKWADGCSNKNVEGIGGMHAKFRLTIKFASLAVLWLKFNTASSPP